MNIEFIRDPALKARLVAFVASTSSSLEEAVELLIAKGLTGSAKSLNSTCTDTAQRKRVIKLLRSSVTPSQIVDIEGLRLGVVVAIRQDHMIKIIKRNKGRTPDMVIAKRLGLKEPGLVMRERNKLGYRRYSSESALAKLDLADLRQALTDGGHDCGTYIKLHKLNIKRERLRQICIAHSIPHGTEDRTDGWYIARLARSYANANFLNKAWVETKFKEGGCSIWNFAALVELTHNPARQLLERHGVLASSPLAERRQNKKTLKLAELVTLVCSNPQCRKTFERNAKQFRTEERKALKKGTKVVSYCNPGCFLPIHARQSSPTQEKAS